jgi:hypothetical protein
MSKWRPDEIIVHEDGSRDEIKYRRSGGPGRVISLTRRTYDKDGNRLGIWHEAYEVNGELRHRHEYKGKE